MKAIADSGICVVTDLGRTVSYSVPSISGGEGSETIAEVSYGRHRGVRFEAVSLFQPQFEQVRWRVTTAWMRLVMRVVLHQSLRRSRQVLRVVKRLVRPGPGSWPASDSRRSGGGIRWLGGQ